MIGHECRLSRTNTNGIVWVCQCGEIGDLTPMHKGPDDKNGRSKRLVELTESVARAKHVAHLERVRADIAADSDRELARIGKLIPKANELLQRRGRFGHP